MPKVPGRGWRLKRSTIAIFICLALVIWTGLAAQWVDRKCPLLPVAYVLALGHGPPDRTEGCKGAAYTDEYRG